jgi:hypothetical protein
MGGDEGIDRPHGQLLGFHPDEGEGTTRIVDGTNDTVSSKSVLFSALVVRGQSAISA